jgi:hypothetical protein
MRRRPARPSRCGSVGLPDGRSLAGPALAQKPGQEPLDRREAGSGRTRPRNSQAVYGHLRGRASALYATSATAPADVHSALTNLRLPWPALMFRKINCHAPCLVVRHQSSRRAASRLILEIDVGERLAGVILHDEAGVRFLDGPRRRESAGQRRPADQKCVYKAPVCPGYISSRRSDNQRGR